jgi:hypothetical protein
MNTNFRRILTAGLAFAVVAGGDVVAQEQTERERQQQEQEAERMRKAEHRVQEAQQQLEQAVQLLQEQESRQAREQLRQAMNELQRAMAELDRSRLTTLYGELGRVGPLAISFASSGPMMGVYLSTERDPAADSIGAVLDNVVEDGPAAEAGLKDGDIITMANGNSLARTSRRDTSPSNKLVGIKDELEVGDTLHVEYRRGARCVGIPAELCVYLPAGGFRERGHPVPKWHVVRRMARGGTDRVGRRSGSLFRNVGGAADHSGARG